MPRDIIAAIEDSDADREKIFNFLVRTYGPKGYRVHVFSDYENFYKECEVEHVAILITDLYIFGSYREVLSALKKINEREANEHDYKSMLHILRTSRRKSIERIKRARRSGDMPIIAFTRFAGAVDSIGETLSASQGLTSRELSRNFIEHTNETFRLLRELKIPIVAKWPTQADNNKNDLAVITPLEALAAQIDQVLPIEPK